MHNKRHWPRLAVAILAGSAAAGWVAAGGPGPDDPLYYEVLSEETPPASDASPEPELAPEPDREDSTAGKPQPPSAPEQPEDTPTVDSGSSERDEAEGDALKHGEEPSTTDIQQQAETGTTQQDATPPEQLYEPEQTEKQDLERPWLQPLYLVGRFGQARGEVGAGEMNARMAALGYEAQAMVDGQNRFAWNLSAGYQWNRYIAVELGYTDLGEVRTELSGVAVDINDYLNSANLVHPRSASGYELALALTYPLDDGWALYGRAGALFARSRYRADAAADTALRPNNDDEVHYGFGVQRNINQRWSLRAGFSRYGIEGEDIDLLSAALVFMPFNNQGSSGKR